MTTGEASYTTTGKMCPAEPGHICQISECWAKGEKPCIRWIAGERPKPVYTLTLATDYCDCPGWCLSKDRPKPVQCQGFQLPESPPPKDSHKESTP